MKSKYLLIALLAFGGSLSAQADTLGAVPKDSAAIINVQEALTTASSSLKIAKKPQDPIVSLMETLASSIDKTNLQIESLQKQGADTGEAEGFIFDAKLHLHTVELSLNPDASSTPSTALSSASTTPSEAKKSKDAIRKKSVEDLKIAYADILNSIKSLKSIILAQREILDGTTADSDVLTGDSATTTASDGATSAVATSSPLTDNPATAN